MTRISYNSADAKNFCHPDDRDYQSKIEKAFSNNGFYEGELRIRHKDGHYVNLSTRSVHSQTG